MLSEIASRYKSPFRPFCPFPSIGDRQAWESLDPAWTARSVALGEECLGCSWPWLSPADYRAFYETGDRSRFEELYFSKRRTLSALALAECAENTGRFLPDVVNGVFSICEESVWTLPAHNNYDRDALQPPLPDTSLPPLDLFAAETGAVLACAVYLLGPVLDPTVVRRVRYELARRIFEPYLHYHFWWMGDGASQVNNWTVWCVQNVLIAAFLTEPTLPGQWGFAARTPGAPEPDDPAAAEELRRRILRQAAVSTDFFLAEYGEDGCCDEGAQYYRHSGLCLYAILDLCDGVTGGAFAPLWREEKIRNIALYIYKVHIADQYYVNFADCSPVAGRAGAREFLFGARTGQSELMAFAAGDFKRGGAESLLMPRESDLYWRAQSAFTVPALRACTLPCPAGEPGFYYPSVGLFAAREGEFFLAVKAGDNGDSHNHNDTGSFTIYKGGQPLFIDVGVETYSKKTFSPQRYEIWTMQSAWHNLPTVDGVMQRDGAEFKAAGVAYSVEEGRISMELAGAYPPEAGLVSFRREIQLTRERSAPSVHITDRFTFREPEKPHEVVLSLMTCDVPEARDGGLAVLPWGDREGEPLAQVSIRGGHIRSIEEVPIEDPRLAAAWKHPIRRTLVALDGDALELDIT